MRTNNFSFAVHPYWIDYSGLYTRAEAIHRAYSSGNLVFFVGSGEEIRERTGDPLGAL